MKKVIAAAAIVLAASSWAARVPPGTQDEIRERVKPYGNLCKAGDPCAQTSAATSGGAARSGEDVYNTYCFACHTAGVSGAPRLANAEDWAPRLDKGMDTLWASTLNGLNMMPAKGTCMDCSDDELRGAMEHMLPQ